jgi:transposase InsO family protein
MLTEGEIKRLMARLDVTAEGQSMVMRIRGSNPSRNVGSKMNNVACRYPSRKMGLTIQAESHTNELAAIYHWEHDANTYEFYDQPGQIKLRYRSASGKPTAHLTTPDYFVIQANYIGWVECKPEEWLEKRRKEGCTLFEFSPTDGWISMPGENYAREFGLGFKVRSSSENSPIYTRNLKFLSDYWNTALPQDYAARVAAIRALFKGQNCWQLTELLSKCGPDQADIVFAAITRDDLYVDLENDVLAEHASTQVYANSEVARAFHALEFRNATTRPSDTDIRAINFETGEELEWDGMVYTIKTVGEGHVYLQADDTKLLKLAKADVEKLVKSGDIKGTRVVAKHSQDLAIEVVTRAATSDLACATKRQDALNQPAHTRDTSERTLRYWKSLQRRGEAIYGDGYIGLIPRTGQRGNRKRKVDSRVVEIMQSVIDSELMSAQGKSTTLCYGIVVHRCREAGLMEPSEKTFRQEIKRTRSPFDLAIAREGARAAYQHEEFVFVLEHSTPRHGDRPFEIAHIDHTEIDLQLVGTTFGENLGRPWLTLMLDAYSRAVLAFVLHFDPPSYRSCMLVMRECIRRHARVPSTLVVDNGKEFGSTYFESLLARVSTTKKSRPPHKSRFGSVMERFFGITNTAFLHNLQGNNKALQKPRQMSATHDPREHAVWTLRALIPQFAQFAYETYGNLEHSALGVSPNDAMRVGMQRTGIRPMRMVPMTPDLELLCLPVVRGDTAQILGAKGIKIGYIYYWHPIMRDPKHEGTRVYARYDPFDVSKAYAFIERQWRPCLSEHASMFKGRSEREIQVISSEIRGKNSRTAVRRKINAEALARYMIGVARTEQVLLQQKRDAESRHSFDASETRGAMQWRDEEAHDTSDESWGDYAVEPCEVLE